MAFVYPFAFTSGAENFDSIIELDPIEGAGTTSVTVYRSDITISLNINIFDGVYSVSNFDLAEWAQAGTYELFFTSNTLLDINGNVTQASLVQLVLDNVNSLRAVNNIRTLSVDGSGTLPNNGTFTTLGTTGSGATFRRRGLGLRVAYSGGARSLSGSVKLGIKPVN